MWACLAFMVMLEGGAMHGAEWMGVGDDRMLRCFPYTLYILIFCLVSFRESRELRERTKFLIHLPLS